MLYKYPIAFLSTDRWEPTDIASVNAGIGPQGWSEQAVKQSIMSKANENIGRIVDVLVDRRGRVRAAIIDFGGFLGVGSRKIAVDWDAMRFSQGEDGRNVVTLDLTRDQMKAAPEYKEKRAVIVLGAASQINPYE